MSRILDIGTLDQMWIAFIVAVIALALWLGVIFFAKSSVLAAFTLFGINPSPSFFGWGATVCAAIGAAIGLFYKRK